MGEQQIALWGWDTGNAVWVKLQVTPAGLIRVDASGISLNDLGDVNAPAPADNDSLTWDAGTGLWIPGARLISVGGLYGINVEVLTGDKTLTPGTDEIYQYLDANGANRIITLATAGATAGDRFIIKNPILFWMSFYLEVMQAAIPLDRIYADSIKGFIFDGTNWVGVEVGTGDNSGNTLSLSLGHRANGYNRAVAVGYEADAHAFGVAVGYRAKAHTSGLALGFDAIGHTRGMAFGVSTDASVDGVAIGNSARGRNFGIAIGAASDTNSKKYAIGLGYQSRPIRTAETSINITAEIYQKYNVVQGRWAGTTTDDTPAEIFLAAIANERFTIRPNSALAFKMTIVARDNVANEVAMYTVEDGLIKRDGANNTVLSNCTLFTVHEDDFTWGAWVTADDVEEALIIFVRGDADNPVQWAVRMDGVETHF